jgi:cytochrome c-type biogenesis protein CcmH/NrfF
MRLFTLLVLLLAALAVASPAAHADPETQPTRADLEDELWCFDCNARLDNAEAANGRIGQELIRIVDERIAAGDTKSEIKGRLVSIYGKRVLYSTWAPKAEAPPALLVDLKDEIMCPVCPGETLEQSSSPAAKQVERFISVRISAGDSKGEIRDRLVAEYGPRILAAPPAKGFDLLAWVLPIAGALAGALLLGFAAWRWSRAGTPATQPARLDPELERRLDRELAGLD